MVKRAVPGLMTQPPIRTWKVSGNIVYNELSQWIAIIADLRFSHQVFSFEFESFSTFAVKKCLLYTRYRSYDSFVVSVTHFHKVDSQLDFQHLSSLSFELESLSAFSVRFVLTINRTIPLSSLSLTLLKTKVNLQCLAPSKTISKKILRL